MHIHTNRKKSTCPFTHTHTRTHKRPIHTDTDTHINPYTYNGTLHIERT